MKYRHHQRGAASKASHSPKRTNHAERFGIGSLIRGPYRPRNSWNLYSQAHLEAYYNQEG